MAKRFVLNHQADPKIVRKDNGCCRSCCQCCECCDNCCRLMPIEYTASTAEEIESLKAIEINYAGKNHTAYFEIK